MLNPNKRNPTPRPVNVYNKQGKLLKTFDSITKACYALDIGWGRSGMNTSSVNRGLKYNRIAMGYYWRYAPYKNDIADEIELLIDRRYMKVDNIIEN